MENCLINGFLSPAQRARFLSAVPQRRSVRAYRGDPDVSQLSALSYTAARVSLPGVRLEICETAPEKIYRHLPMVSAVHGTRRCAAVIVDESVPHALIHAGISGEALILEAVSMGLGTCWVAFFKRSGVPAALMEGEKTAAVIALGVPDEENAPRRRKTLNEICLSDAAAWPLWAYHAADCVRLAPSALNRQPWQMAFAGRMLQLNRAGLGTDLDMGIALLHMSLGVGETPHQVYWGKGKEIAFLAAEDPQ